MDVHLVNAIRLFFVFADDAAGFRLEFLQFRFELLVRLARDAERERAHYCRFFGRRDECLLREFKTLQLVLLDEFRVVVRPAANAFASRLPESVSIFARKPETFQQGE